MALGSLYAENGQFETGELLLRDTLVKARTVFGGSSCRILWQQRKFEDSQPKFTDYVDGMKRIGREDDPDVLDAELRMAFTIEHQGNHALARLLYMEGLNGAERVLGKAHAVTMGYLTFLARLSKKQGRTEEAEGFRLELDRRKSMAEKRDQPE
ncbi:hypothetical protein HDV00_002400 [Rhizophlyctis rosea]|nr:hypothetical protein HDV00_002400 [Rhizophlyctis rosea]